MLKKIFSLTLFFLSFCYSFSEGVQSKEYKIDEINRVIEELKLQQMHLELMKEEIEKSNIDLSKKVNFNEKRPKIALVLSGGGAKGAAHIGVLRVLEKYQVPIDIIVGTSVGSIVGGMYSVDTLQMRLKKLFLT